MLHIKDFGQLLSYYHKEMWYLLEGGKRFAHKYPHVAKALDWGTRGSGDPHVERLLESFAFLSSRLQANIDDHASFLTSALLGSIYPYFSSPFPACTVLKLESSEKMARQNAGITVPAQTMLSQTNEEGNIFHFQTSMDVTLWPLTITHFGYQRSNTYDFSTSLLQSPWLLSMTIKSKQGPIKQWDFNKLCFYLSGDILSAQELLGFILGYNIDSTAPVFLYDPVTKEAPLRLAPGALKAVGLNESEALIPPHTMTPKPYRLLAEYLNFPQKFLFFNIEGFQPLVKQMEGNECHVLIPLPSSCRPEKLPVSTYGIQLGCTPAINLFTKMAEPIRLHQRSHEYKLVPDKRLEKTTEIHSILSVSETPDAKTKERLYHPYFSFNHDIVGDEPPCFWLARRTRTLDSNMKGTDIFLSFVDYNMDFQPPTTQTIYAKTLCTNRFVDTYISAGTSFDIDASLAGVNAITLERSTPEAIPPLDGETQWRLISHLSLDHLSLCQQKNERVALFKELFTLYSRAEQHPDAMKHTLTLSDIRCQEGMGHINFETWRGFVPKILIDIIFDDVSLNGVYGKMLFSLILSEFFTLSAEFNTLVETRVYTAQHDMLVKKWPPLFSIRSAL